MCSPGQRRSSTRTMSAMTAPPGEVTMPMRRKARQRAFALVVEQALGGQLLLALLEGQLQRAVALRLHGFDVELVLAARLVDADPAAAQDLQPVLGLHLEVHGVLPEADAFELRLIVLEREVVVAAGGAAAVGDLPRHPHALEDILEQRADDRRQLGDGEGAPFGRKR